mmetsp:Transcript_25026/g.59491  ORF Transcript_25026/g.59491 Transcript_25026/m.59491 type:complete len:82 (+) Transcript_25026:1634-1879(+)
MRYVTCAVMIFNATCQVQYLDNTQNWLTAILKHQSKAMDLREYAKSIHMYGRRYDFDQFTTTQNRCIFVNFLILLQNELQY